MTIFRVGLRWRAMVAACLAMMMTAPASAQHLPEPAAVALPEEAAVLRDLTSLATTRQTDQAALLTALDGILARLPRPTPLRGIVQTLRAQLLRYRDDWVDAIDAAEEAARLLPRSTGPLLVAAYIEGYRDNGEAAAAYLLRAGDIDARALQGIDDYELGNILSRLPADRHQQVRQRLVRRLFDSGWRGQSVVRRSGLARETIIHRAAEGDVAGARALISHLVDPTDVYDLLARVALQPIWPDLEIGAGPEQRILWPLHLSELRVRWSSSRDHQRARDYVFALNAAQRHGQAVTELSPLFANPRADEDYDLQWVAPSLAYSLAYLGRWDEADALLTRLLTIWPVGSEANALNLLANRGGLRAMRGDQAGAIADMTAAIADANRRGGEVSSRALAPMHRVLACALHEAGRSSEAIPSASFVFNNGSPGMIAELHLCLGNPDAARESLMAGLESEDPRAAIIAFMQPDKDPPLPSEIGRRNAERLRLLKADPRLIAALAPYGRILPYRAGAGATPLPRP